MGFFEIAPVITSSGVDEDGRDMLSFLWSIHDDVYCPLVEWWKICERLGEQNERSQAATEALHNWRLITQRDFMRTASRVALSTRDTPNTTVNAGWT